MDIESRAREIALTVADSHYEVYEQTVDQATAQITALVREARVENAKHILNQLGKLHSHNEHPMGGYPVVYQADISNLMNRIIRKLLAQLTTPNNEKEK